MAVLELTADERIPAAFLIAVEVGHLRDGTKEHHEAAAGLREVYTSLMDAEPGPIMVELSNDELYMLGLRVFVTASEVEEWWLDNRASRRATHEPAPFADPNFGQAVERFYPDLVSAPDSVDFDKLRGMLGRVARKVDLELISQSRSRGLYNKERAEINRRIRADQERRAAARARRYPAVSERESWRLALRVDQLGVGQMTDVEIEGRRILIANTGEGFAAMDAVCTHVPPLGLLNTLAGGELDLGNMCVSCPWHGSKFDLRTGKVVEQPYPSDFKKEHFVAGRIAGVLDPKKTASDTRVYATKVHANMVWVNLG